MRLKKKSHQAKLEVGKKSQGEYQVKEIYNIDRYISMIELISRTRSLEVLYNLRIIIG